MAKCLRRRNTRFCGLFLRVQRWEQWLFRCFGYAYKCFPLTVYLQKGAQFNSGSGGEGIAMMVHEDRDEKVFLKKLQ